jgi:hypothetical protein
VIAAIKTKQDLVKALNSQDVRLIADIEVVNDSGLKTIDDKVRSLLRQQKKLHIVLLERN